MEKEEIMAIIEKTMFIVAEQEDTPCASVLSDENKLESVHESPVAVADLVVEHDEDLQ